MKEDQEVGTERTVIQPSLSRHFAEKGAEKWKLEGGGVGCLISIGHVNMTLNTLESLCQN